MTDTEKLEKLRAHLKVEIDRADQLMVAAECEAADLLDSALSWLTGVEGFLDKPMGLAALCRAQYAVSESRAQGSKGLALRAVLECLDEEG